MRSWPDALAAGRVPWTVYLLRCRDGSLYTGITNDLPQRLALHRRGKASAYTRARLPVALAYQELASDRGSALKREAAIRRLSRSEKLALCNAET
jgi:putative endonuclease